MSSKYNHLAAQVRRLRSQVEGWPQKKSNPSALGEKHEYCELQWRSFSAHRKHCEILGDNVYSPGDALRRVKGFISQRAYGRDRNVERDAAQWRHHPLRSHARWRPVVKDEVALFPPATVRLLAMLERGNGFCGVRVAAVLRIQQWWRRKCFFRRLTLQVIHRVAT